MTRVRSQMTRQAVLVTGDQLDPSTLPEKMQLFNELGEPLMMGGGSGRYTKTIVTADISPQTPTPGDVDLNASVRLWKLATDRPARVRMYPTAAQRDRDLPRGIGVRPPAGNNGRLIEVVTAADFLELYLSPVVEMTSSASDSEKFYYSITNLDSSSNPVVVTLNYFRTE